MPFTYVARAKTVVELVPVAIRCNACGKERTAAEHGEHEYTEDMQVIELGGGWGDRYPGDMETISFVACGDCLRKWTSTFVVEPESQSAVGHPPPLPTTATHSETGETWVIGDYWAYPEGTDFVEPDDDYPSCADIVDIPGDGVYEHFKGRRYEVLKCVVANPKAPEVLVMYRALYGESKVFVRPATMWSQEVEHEGRRVPRFRPLDEEPAKPPLLEPLDMEFLKDRLAGRRP
jgi:hypothetical protein